MGTASQQKMHRKPGHPVSNGLRLAAERVPALLTQLAARAERIESAVASAWAKRARRGRASDPEGYMVETLTERAAQLGQRPEWDQIDEASWESFPASDAPASWAGHDRDRFRSTN